MERRCSRFEGLKALSRERGNGRVIAGGELFEKRVRLVELLGGEVVIGEVEEVVFVVWLRRAAEMAAVMAPLVSWSLSSAKDN